MVEIIPNWHPIFVHFTIALLSVAAALKLGSYLVGNESLRDQWRLVARWNLWIGSGFVVLTVIAGVVAYNTVSHDTPSHAAMTNHRNWALVTAAVFLAIAGWLTLQVRSGRPRSGLFVAILVVATGLLGITAWKGGELVYRYGLGVMSLPKTDQHHHHGDEEGEDHHHADDDHADGHHDEPMSGSGHGQQEMSAHDAADDHHHTDETADHHHDDDHPHQD